MCAPISRLPRAISEATLIQPRDSSSVTRQYSKQPSPRPPHFSGSSLLATGSTSLSVNSCACSWIMRRSSVMYGILRVPESHEVGALEVDREFVALVEALGMPGDDAEPLVRVRYAPVQHLRL